MDAFISELRKINTDGLIFEFSKLSIEMFKNDEAMKGIELPIKRFGVVKSARVGLSAWDIPLIEYLSVMHSNDYRRAKCLPSLGQLVNSFRKYDNEHSIASVMKNGDADVVFRAILGLTAEQFQFQDKSWIFDKINRDYYILYAAKHFELKCTPDTGQRARSKNRKLDRRTYSIPEYWTAGMYNILKLDSTLQFLKIGI